MPDDRDERQEYVDDMVRRRGYVLDYHRVMAAQDLAVLLAADGLVSAAYLDQRSLDRRTKGAVVHPEPDRDAGIEVV